MWAMNAWAAVLLNGRGRYSRKSDAVMSQTWTDRTLALAAVFHTAALVQTIARQGTVPPSEFTILIDSIFCTDPPNTLAVYGGHAHHLKRGLTLLWEQLSGRTARDPEITSYIVALLHLERQLSKRPGMIEELTTGIERAKIQATHFDTTHSNVIANLAGLYAATISTLQPRILVNGEPNHLSNTENANKIRALLLAGIRAAVLWRQCGGRRWQLLFQRGSLIREARQLAESE